MMLNYIDGVLYFDAELDLRRGFHDFLKDVVNDAWNYTSLIFIIQAGTKTRMGLP
jgi:hypothetical protein